MPQKRQRDDSDSLQILLNKAKAINTINGESIELIQARKGQKVIVGYKYVYSSKQPKEITNESDLSQSTSPTHNNEDATHEGEMVTTQEHETKEVDHIIESWRYTGHPLLQGRTPFDRISDIKLERFAN